MFVAQENDVLLKPNDDIIPGFRLGIEIPNQALESMQQMTWMVIHMTVSTSTV
jgi:hypothetical protein